MKKGNTRRNFKKFTSRNTHKRKKRKESTEELLRIVENMGIGTDGAVIRDSRDFGVRSRISGTRRKDEFVIQGEFSGTRSGFGFVICEGEDIFIPEGKCGGAIDGDIVEVVYRRYKNAYGEDKTDGRVTKIIKYQRETIVGIFEEEVRYFHRKRVSYPVVIPKDGKIPFAIRVIEDGGAKIGELVSARLVRGAEIRANVAAVLGQPDSREANYEAILIEAGIPLEFTKEESALAETFAKEPIDYENRKDLRGDIIFTIDGAGAKDLDDAISLSKRDDGWMLGVHIADVSHYVKEKTALERAAMARGTSVYFVDKVVPMLPEALSCGVCSLFAGEDKCAISAFINFDLSGNIISTEILSTVIRSRVRGVYEEVNKIFLGTASEEIKEKYKDVLKTLFDMRELYLILKDKALARGMLDLDLPESVISLDADGMPNDVFPAIRGDAERLIEQFMLAANEAVATKLAEAGAPVVWRTHGTPPVEKFTRFLEYARNLGLDTHTVSEEKPTPQSLQKLLLSAERLGVGEEVSYSLLRSMAKAEYSDVHSPHFGLGISNYCHFTSPIRRLSDLAVHRIIHRVLFEGKSPARLRSYARRTSILATEAEVRAVSAERRIENLYKAIYMSKKIGDIFRVKVSSIQSFGMFVMPENTCEGLIPIEDLGDYFVYDEGNITLRSNKHTYHIGDEVDARLEAVDISSGKIRFSVV